MPQSANPGASLRARSRSVAESALDSLANLDVGLKVKIPILALGLAPPLAALVLMRSGWGDHVQNALALYIAAFLILYYPLARTLEELIVLRQTRRLNAYVDRIKAGRPAPPGFSLPEEKNGEHDFLRLQRNIFWMVSGLKNREAQLQENLAKLKTAQRQVLESIEYAGRIQRSFLPSAADMKDALGEHFLLWRPRDGVGGDAYWVRRERDHTFLAVFDCTGHGVPGAFLTLIVNSLFEQNVDPACADDPARLLAKMNQGLKTALYQHGRDPLSDDGLEGAVCCIENRGDVLHFAGARSVLLAANENGVTEVRGDRSGVGFARVPMEQEFANHRIHLRGVRAVYLYTDGVTDQIGGPRRLPFGRTRLRRLLESRAHLPLAEQGRSLERDFDEYKGGNAQRDDVTVLGFATKEFLC